PICSTTSVPTIRQRSPPSPRSSLSLRSQRATCPPAALSTPTPSSPSATNKSPHPQFLSNQSSTRLTARLANRFFWPACSESQEFLASTRALGQPPLQTAQNRVPQSFASQPIRHLRHTLCYFIREYSHSLEQTFCINAHLFCHFLPLP